MVRRGGFLAVLLVCSDLSWALAESRVVGSVTDPAGKSMEGAVIRLEPSEAGQPALEVKTKKKGQFFFGLVREGEYRLVAMVEGMRVSAVDITIRDKENRKTFEKKGALALGSPMPQISVGEFDSVTYNLTVTPSSAEGGQTSTGPALTGTGDIVDLVQKGDLAKARKEIDRSLESAPDDPKTLYLSAFLYVQENNDAAALSAVEKAIRASNTFPGVHFLKGVLLDKGGSPRAALEEFKREAEAADNPDLKRDAYVRIAVEARKLQLDDEALTALKRVVELDPANSVAFSQLLDIYLRKEMTDEVGKLLAVAPDEVKNDPAVHYNIGVQYWNSKNVDAAVQAFVRAIDLAPEMADAHRQLGYCEVNRGNIQNALKELNRYLELAPKAPDAAEVRDLIARLQK